MKPITASLALSQLKQNRKRTILTIVGIVLSVGMITAVFGFAASGMDALRSLLDDQSINDYNSLFVGLSVIFGSIIIVASVIVISNAFRISASERLRQFGILKSTGATKRQILNIVLYEGLYLSLIAIPAGIALGLFVEWIGTGISDALLAPMNKFLRHGASIHMRFVLNIPSVLLAMLLSFATIMLSAYIPARKAARVPAIEAIRLTREIRYQKSKPRAYRLAGLLFGFEGTLAAKTIRRSRKSYRAMVAALTISVVLFLVCGSLETQLNMTMNMSYLNVDATSYVSLSGDGVPLQNTTDLTGKMAAYPDTKLYGLQLDTRYDLVSDSSALDERLVDAYTNAEGTLMLSVALVTPDPAHYAELCALAGVPAGSNILINSTRLTVDGKSTEFKPLAYSGQTLTLQGPEQTFSLPLHGQLTGAQAPQEIAASISFPLIIVVADAPAYQCYWYASSLDPEGFTSYAQELLTAYVDQNISNTDGYSYGAEDITAITDMTRGLTRLVSMFLYGFVGTLSLIGLTSVLSAISASVQLRAREFAVLKSVGMTERGVRRMLALESLMSAFKALLYGIPLGSLAMYMTLWALVQRRYFQFVYPWLTLAEAVAGVLVIALIATQYAAGKLRGGSIIDTIRMGDGV